MKTKLIRIGNSRGVRLPKTVISQAGLRENEVEMIVREGEVVLRSPPKIKTKRNPRAGWDQLMAQAVATVGNELTHEDRQWLDAPLSEEADKEWTW